MTAAERLLDALARHIDLNVGLTHVDMDAALLKAQAAVVDAIPDLGPGRCARCLRICRRQTFQYGGRTYGPSCIKKVTRG